MTGMVYLIGAGPGDVKLITVKGRECIEKADVIVYDYLADAHLLEWARPDAELIYAGKQCKDHTMHQWEINELLVQKGKEGKIVARLKGGDPLVFGRGGEEAMALAEAGVPIRTRRNISNCSPCLCRYSCNTTRYGYILCCCNRS